MAIKQERVDIIYSTVLGAPEELCHLLNPKLKGKTRSLRFMSKLNHQLITRLLNKHDANKKIVWMKNPELKSDCQVALHFQAQWNVATSNIRLGKGAVSVTKYKYSASNLVKTAAKENLLAIYDKYMHLAKTPKQRDGVMYLMMSKHVVFMDEETLTPEDKVAFCTYIENFKDTDYVKETLGITSNQLEELKLRLTSFLKPRIGCVGLYVYDNSECIESYSKGETTYVKPCMRHKNKDFKFHHHYAA